jgi:alcohol dehydrogenase class IV
MQPFVFRSVGTILFGEGRSREIGALSHKAGWRRVLVVTDRGILGAHLLDPALKALKAAHVEVVVFSDVTPDPPESVIPAGVAAAREAQADAVIGFGGGSCLDAAKLVALLARSGEALADIYGVEKVTGARLPLVLVPTTAGTGSEVTPIAIVTTGAHEKKGVVSPVLLPDVALLDPALTYALPHQVTAATGIDAMVHAIEAYASASPNNNPMSRMMAREALHLLGDSIRSAVREGTHPEARARMMRGSMLAGQAFANSPVAAVHALAYPLGGHFHLPHGLSNALVLPHVLRFNLPAANEAYAEIAPCAFPWLGEIAAARRGGAFVEALEHLSAEIGLPARLRDAGVPHEALPLLADDAMKQERLLVNNPRAVTRADALAIYEAAW